MKPLLYTTGVLAALLLGVVMGCFWRRKPAPAAPRIFPRLCDITVLMTNFTGMVGVFESLGDSRAVALLNRALALLTDAAQSHGGIIQQMVFDRVIILFGPLRRLDNHAASALRCALAMQAAIDKLCEQLASESLPRLALRIGIATGDALVGDIGSERRFSFEARGDVMNEARYFELACKERGARNLIGATTHMRGAGRLDFIPRGVLSPARGLAQQVFEVVT